MIRILSLITAIIVVASCNNPTYRGKQSSENGIRIVSLARSISKEIESLDMGGSITFKAGYCFCIKPQKRP